MEVVDASVYDPLDALGLLASVLEVIVADLVWIASMNDALDMLAEEL